MTTSSLSRVKYEDLLKLNHDQLLLSSLDLVDRASINKLRDCYENIFKDSIIRYLLKTVIKQEIEQLSTKSCDDWKRVSLIKKITKLTSNANTNCSQMAVATGIISSDYNPIPPLSSTLVSILADTQHENNKNDKNKTSTDKLLLSGYIRNEMNITNNNNFPSDILSICQLFIQNCSNMVDPQKLIVFNHSNNEYKSVFDDNDTYSTLKVKSVPFENELRSKLSSSDIETKLIAPYKIMLFNGNYSNLYCYDKLPHYSEAIDIKANIQQIGSSQNEKTGGMLNKSLLGVVQYLDVNRWRLLNFGGIEQITSYGMDMGYNYNRQQRKINTSYFTRKQILSLPLFRNKTDPEYASMGSPSNLYQTMLKQLNITSSPAVTQSNFISPNAWTWRDSDNASISSLVHGRGYMSLCDIGHSKLAIIGGQRYNTNDKISTTTKQCVVDYVEICDLNGNNGNILLKGLNHGRQESGSCYIPYTKEMIVFGGNRGNYLGNTGEGVSRMMEIYDFHKNIWFDVPYLSKKIYNNYPCIWTVGSKCIFVAKLLQTAGVRLQVECEWIDLRVCDKNGRNKSQFNVMHPIDMNSCYGHVCSMFTQ